jgi:hypothetical protein
MIVKRMKYPFFSFSRRELVKLKLWMKKQGYWFKTLSRIDRVLIDLAIEVTDGVRSSRLADALQSIAKKIEDKLENRVSFATDRIGIPLARRLGMLAQKWGNNLALEWTTDPLFARFLAILHINCVGGQV